MVVPDTAKKPDKYGVPLQMWVTIDVGALQSFHVQTRNTYPCGPRDDHTTLSAIAPRPRWTWVSAKMSEACRQGGVEQAGALVSAGLASAGPPASRPRSSSVAVRPLGNALHAATMSI